MFDRALSMNTHIDVVIPQSIAVLVLYHPELVIIQQHFFDGNEPF